MARSTINTPSNDIRSDSGSVLFSLILGEQIEFPLDLTFANIDVELYVLDAVIIEGDNDGIGSMPDKILEGGASDTVNIRVPINKGTWDAIAVYDQGDYVIYDDGINGEQTYIKIEYDAGADPTTPDISYMWQPHIKTVVYIQIPSTIGSNYDVAPLVDKHTYGFFELKVSEPITSPFRQTWKPTRGMVELLFSPTAL